MAENVSYPSGVVLTTDANWEWQGGRERKPRRFAKDLNKAISQSVADGGYWEKGTFTVPAGIPDERVQFLGHRYILKFGKVLEDKGLKVQKVVGPMIDTRPRPVEPDRRRYIIYAFVSCQPFQPTYNIPDKYVPDMLKVGLRLLE